MDINPHEPTIEHKTYSAAARLIGALDEKREIVRFGRYENTILSNCRGSVLIFLPGLGEIEAMHKVLLVSNSVVSLDSYIKKKKDETFFK